MLLWGVGAELILGPVDAVYFEEQSGLSSLSCYSFSFLLNCIC